MSDITIQDILSLVQMPSRYLGCEVNHIKKPWESVHLHVALAFPDLYEIATSHFGIQILYAMLNDRNDILVERVFAPAEDMEALLREKQRGLCSLESSTPLHKFDIIGFSLLYELNYTNMINMLDLAGISLFSQQRQSDEPFVIAGGPCMCNPEPVADFFDAIVIGDGEAVILPMMDAWMKWHQSDSGRRADLLERWSKIKGVYIPSFFDYRVDGSGNQRLAPKKKNYQHIERAVVADLNEAPFPSTPIIPFGRPVHDRLRMEIARGCTRGCRFCQAGMIYRPVRERQPEKIVSAVKQALRQTGYEDLSLLSLSSGDYSCIAPLMQQIMAFGEEDHVAVSLPSLRAGSLTPELMELIQRVRKTGFTIAPEAGSQRLRNVINKNITEADIEKTVEDAFSLGWKLIKLYFMIGLPTETADDLQAIVDLVKRLKRISGKNGRRGSITVSIATFVPKPHTPFQWESQLGLDRALQKMNWLKEHLKLPGVHVKWQDPRVSLVEGVWARGDRRLANLLVDAWKSGCRFDGWSDHFDFDRWKRVFAGRNLNPETLANGVSDTSGSLPWDHVRMGVEREFLLAERKRALEEELTPDCRTGNCSGCGVCDFSTLQPVSYHDATVFSAEQPRLADVLPQERDIKYVVTFKKMETARLLGHLEMLKIFTRALRREKVALKYSRGYHPMPKIAFMDTLPMGMQSEAEEMIITVTESLDPEGFCTRLNQSLPDGLQVTGCRPASPTRRSKQTVLQSYRVKLKDGLFRQKELDWFHQQQQVPIERKNKKGSVRLDLKEAVERLDIINPQQSIIVLKKVGNLTIRPAIVMKAVFQLTDRQILTAKITKRKTEYV